MKNQNKLKRQDRFLFCYKELNGSTIVKRKSPFDKQTDYLVLTIQNQFTGSFSWVLREVMLKDSQHFDMFVQTVKDNAKIREKELDNRIHKETAELIQSNEKFVA